ncbi:MAG: DNA repair protein RadC [Treponema sp.]|jgi:DNA repair protein RadC|nr:DNA repair protein RadC [Treponema sp.]
MDHCSDIYSISKLEPRDDEYFSAQERSPTSLPPDSRPRERLIAYGPEALTDSELLAILLNTGVQGKNVNLLAAELLDLLDRERGIPSIEELCQLTGLGASKASAIVAMLEFGKRRWGASGTRIRRPDDIFNVVRHFADRRQERFVCLSMNGAHELLKVRTVTLGLVNKTIVHPREVFADPILDRASAIAVAHNHPSGQTTPSPEDGDVTAQLVESAKILGLRFLDHVIFTDVSFYSYRQAGLLK